jgi:two-component system sensor histidine kinase DegS
MSFDNSLKEKIVEEKKWDLNAELEETNKAIKEIEFILEQSQIEFGKLSQRNTALAANLQQIYNQSKPVLSEDIKLAYDSMLDSQQRLFIMRGKLEKLQSDKTHLEKYRSLLFRISEILNSEKVNLNVKGPTASLEMVINAQEAERQRLSRQMHDGPAQALSNFILQTEIAMRLMNVDMEQARGELVALKTSAMGNFQKIRNFIFELRPMMLDDLGMIPTIRRYADIIKEQSGIDISVSISGTDRRLESYIEVMIFRAFQELLGNAIRHGQANQIKVQTDLSDNLVKLVVDDNGKGFNLEIISKEGNLGLRLIKERVELLGGNFLVDSVLGKGTRVTLSLPIKK